jgi:phage baseplate assembly protein W
MNLELEQQLRRQLLGWGLACNPVYPGLDLGRDLEMTVGANGRDFTRIEAMDNLSQSLEIALTTLLGSDIFNTQFGFDGLNALVEETSPILVQERIRIAIIQVLRKDNRVRRIIDVKLLDRRLDPPDIDTDSHLSFEERLERWRTLNVRVVFETVSGDEASINMGVNLGRMVVNV